MWEGHTKKRVGETKIKRARYKVLGLDRAVHELKKVFKQDSGQEKVRKENFKERNRVDRSWWHKEKLESWRKI